MTTSSGPRKQRYPYTQNSESSLLNFGSFGNESYRPLTHNYSENSNPYRDDWSVGHSALSKTSLPKFDPYPSQKSESIGTRGLDSFGLQHQNYDTFVSGKKFESPSPSKFERGTSSKFDPLGTVKYDLNNYRKYEAFNPNATPQKLDVNSVSKKIDAFGGQQKFEKFDQMPSKRFELFASDQSNRYEKFDSYGPSKSEQSGAKNESKFEPLSLLNTKQFGQGNQTFDSSAPQKPVGLSKRFESLGPQKFEPGDAQKYEMYTNKLDARKRDGFGLPKYDLPGDFGKFEPYHPKKLESPDQKKLDSFVSRNFEQSKKFEPVESRKFDEYVLKNFESPESNNYSPYNANNSKKLEDSRKFEPFPSQKGEPLFGPNFSKPINNKAPEYDAYNSLRFDKYSTPKYDKFNSPKFDMYGTPKYDQYVSAHNRKEPFGMESRYNMSNQSLTRFAQVSHQSSTPLFINQSHSNSNSESGIRMSFVYKPSLNSSDPDSRVRMYPVPLETQNSDLGIKISAYNPINKGRFAKYNSKPNSILHLTEVV